jgi:hypothetical protein
MNPIVPEEGVVINKAEARRLFHDYFMEAFGWTLAATLKERLEMGSFVNGKMHAAISLSRIFGVPIEVIEGIPAKEEAHD